MALGILNKITIYPIFYLPKGTMGFHPFRQHAALAMSDGYARMFFKSSVYDP